MSYPLKKLNAIKRLCGVTPS